MIRRVYERIVKKKEEFEQMKKNADAKHEEIQSGMVETNKRRKQIAIQLKQKEEELEELKRVCLHFFRFSSRLISVFSYRLCLFAGSGEK